MGGAQIVFPDVLEHTAGSEFTPPSGLCLGPGCPYLPCRRLRLLRASAVRDARKESSSRCGYRLTAECRTGTWVPPQLEAPRHAVESFTEGRRQSGSARSGKRNHLPHAVLIGCSGKLLCELPPAEAVAGALCHGIIGGFTRPEAVLLQSGSVTNSHARFGRKRLRTGYCLH